MKSDARRGRAGWRCVVGFAAAALVATAADAQNVEIMSQGPSVPFGKAQGRSYSRFPLVGDDANPRSTVSEDGQLVVFVSDAPDVYLDQRERNTGTDVFLYDARARKTTLVSHEDLLQHDTSDGVSDQPVISPDGRWVVFRSTATNIVPGIYPGRPAPANIYAWEVGTPNYFLVSHEVGKDTTGGDGASRNAVISGNSGGARVVAFESVARNLIANDGNGVSDVFRFEIRLGVDVERVSVSNSGAELVEPSFRPAISAQGAGSCIVYESEDRLIVSREPLDDQNTARDIFKWAGGTTILVSHRWDVDNSGTGAIAADGESVEPSVSDTCEQFAYKSTAKDLVDGSDGNGAFDIFHSNAGGRTGTSLASHRFGVADDASDDESESPILSRDGRWVAFASEGTNLVNGQADMPNTLDVFVFDADPRTPPNLSVTIVSHLPGTPRAAAGRDGSSSHDPQISRDGLYIAYTSNSRDVADFQNDGEDNDDVFLWNQRWDFSIVISRRKASMSLVGNDASTGPAISGVGFHVAFQSLATNLFFDDADNGVQDAFYFAAPTGVDLLTVRSTTENTIEWITPPVDFQSMELVRKAGSCPTSVGDGTQLPINTPTPMRANAKGFFVDNGVTQGTLYCYGAFVQPDVGAFIAGRRTTATPFLPGQVHWRFYTGATAVSPPGIGPSGAYVVSNDKGFYAVTRGASGGVWPASWWPLRFTSPIQARVGVPPVSIPVGALTTSNAVFLGEQPPGGEGRVFGVDADRGALVGGLAWASNKLGEGFQGAMAVLFAAFGAPGNFVIAGTRNSALPNSLHALQATDGQWFPAGTFDNGGVPIGVINAGPTVEYGNPTSRVYFTSNQVGGGSPHTLWCLNVTAAGLDSTPCGTADLGDLDIGPTLRGGRVYVGDQAGRVYAFDSTLGTPHWSFAAVPGAIQGFVAIDRQTQDLFAVGGGQIAGFTDDVTSASMKPGFPITLPTPSIPLFVRIGTTPYLYVGTADGEVCQIDTDQGDAGILCRALETGSIQIGAPTFDAQNLMIYVGSTPGTIYGVRVPFTS